MSSARKDRGTKKSVRIIRNDTIRASYIKALDSCATVSGCEGLIKIKCDNSVFAIIPNNKLTYLRKYVGFLSCYFNYQFQPALTRIKCRYC